MAEDGAVCGICSQPPKNPHTMLCGHTFCLNPCLAPVDLNQSFVQCPFCHIETHIAYLKPGTSMQSSCTEPCQGVDPECITSCPVPEECEHRSDTNCPVSKALESVKEKLACLSTSRASLEPLQSALRKSASCKMSLLTEVIAAGRELRYSTYVSLEKVKLLVASTYTEELTRLKKLQRHLLRLKKRRDTLLQTASDMPEELTLSTLKELEQSTRTLIDRAKDIQKSVESIEGSNLDNLELNPKCASIRHQLENLSLVTSESVNVQGQLAVLPTVTETSKPAEQTTSEVAWNLNPNCIFINRLPDVTKDCDLHEYFSQFGLITDVKVLRNTRDPESLGCAFVTFLETDSVRRVLETQPHLLAENQIIVRVARRKKTEADGTRISVSDKEDDDSLSDEDKSNGDASVLSSDQLTIFVGFLKPEVTESELKAYFSEFGRVSMAQIVHDWITGKSRGFGFVKFADSTAFKRGVLKACHFLNGSRLSVKRSMDRAQSRATCDRPPRELRPERLREEDVNPKGIFVSNLPEVTKDCNLYEYFSKFGLITDVFLLKDTKRLDSRRCGMVFFREADSVKKVFAAQPHLINATQVTIMPARKKNSNDIKPHTKMKMSHGGTSTSTLNTATIFVGRLKPTTTEDDLERYFSKFGTVLDVEVITDRSTGRSRGFAFVTFADEKVFEGGMLEVRHFLHGSRLTVQPSERKSDKVFKSVFNL